MSSPFEHKLEKGTVFSIGIQRWLGVCLGCKEPLGSSDISENMKRIMMTKRVVAWIVCPKCKQQHEIIGVSR